LSGMPGADFGADLSTFLHGPAVEVPTRHPSNGRSHKYVHIVHNMQASPLLLSVSTEYPVVGLVYQNPQEVAFGGLVGDQHIRPHRAAVSIGRQSV